MFYYGAPVERLSGVLNDRLDKFLGYYSRKKKRLGLFSSAYLRVIYEKSVEISLKDGKETQKYAAQLIQF